MAFSCDPDQEGEDLPLYEHIYQNDFSSRKHRKQKEEDIAICECRFDFGDPDSACGERCLNVLTSTECTPGYCPCGVYCKNQKFQKCEYAKTKLIKTEGRGWGLLAAEDLKAGQFIIEYCGEVISWKEAKRRAPIYEAHGLKDAYIISLNASEAIDASKKGSLARFINHSCRPNCETRKWTVLGELRVGIFAKENISYGSELSYDYNFEWYGGAKVRCLCGAVNCSEFLGAKSRGFLEDTYVWEDGDDRYSVDKIPLYDSAEDEPSSKLPKTYGLSDFGSNSNDANQSLAMMNGFESTALVVQPFESTPTESLVLEAVKTELKTEVNTEVKAEVNTEVKTEVKVEVKTETSEEMKIVSQDAPQPFSQKNAIISRIKSNSACKNYQIKSGPVIKKRAKQSPGGKSKNLVQKPVDAKLVAQLFARKESQEEILKYDELKNEAASKLSSLYDEIRPAIEEHERDSQDSVSTSVAEKWIEACCSKIKSEFDLYSSIIKHIACAPRKPQEDEGKISAEGDDNEMKVEPAS